MGDLPTGVVTFLFTDVVGSTRRWAEQPDAMDTDLVVHDQIVRAVIGRHGGYVFSTAGDAFVAAFSHPSEAVGAAVDAQRELSGAEWSLVDGLSVRMGIHTGAANERGGDYFGPTLNECARLMSSAHGGQIVMSLRTRELLPDVAVLSLGSHSLRDLSQPMEVFQVAAEGLEQSFQPLRSLGSGLSTLPDYRSAFIGRREEIDRVRRKLADGRLVTLTGVGGVGKTRLAVEAAAEELPAYPGGVFFVELDSVRESESVLSAVLTGIGLTPSDPTLNHAALVDFLRERTVLLVLDNCEHLLDPVAELVDELLRQAPASRILATSREALDVDGESVLRVPSLGVEADAVRLFADRAMAVNDEFDLEIEHEVILELCRKLDGIPLAIELAATATWTLTPVELLAGLDERFTLLRGGRRRGTLGRQRTLEATVDWSHDLLEEDEQVAFRRLGVFAGPFIFDVVPRVLDLDQVQARDVLDRLVEKSLVVPFRIDNERTGFRLLETLRVYAVGKLVAAGEQEKASERLVDAFVNWIDASWIAVVRNDWGFWRWFRAQMADIWRVADALEEAGRIDDLARVLEVSINGSGSPAWDIERLRRLELIDHNHLHELDTPAQADVIGSLSIALTISARMTEAVQRAALAWAEFDSEPISDKRMIVFARLITLSLVDPHDGVQLADEALAALGDSKSELTDRQLLLYMKAMCVASLRDFDDAAQLAGQSFVPQDCELRDSALTTLLWFSHLAGSQVDADRLALARSSNPKDGYWRQSVRIASAMHHSDPGVAAQELSAIAEQGWNGLLPFEEAEYLVAFARLAQLRGDENRARDLLDCTMVRSPWTAVVMAEILCTIDRWPYEQWNARLAGLVLDRVALDRIEEIRRTAGPMLAEEVDRWC